MLFLSPWGNLNYNSVNILWVTHPHSEKIYPTFVECSRRNVINICQKDVAVSFVCDLGRSFKARTWFVISFTSVSWPDCFVRLNPGVQIMKQRLAKFQWMCTPWDIQTIFICQKLEFGSHLLWQQNLAYADCYTPSNKWWDGWEKNHVFVQWLLLYSF